MNPAHSQPLATASFTDFLHDNNSLSSAIFFFQLTVTRSLIHCLFVIYFEIFNAKLDQFAIEDS